MFGGKLEMGSGNVTDELWVFNTQSKSWAQQSPSTPAHGQVYAVEGHSAHIAELDTGDVVMVVIFGYSSIYSYISNVQEYNISECVTDLMFNSKEKWCKPISAVSRGLHSVISESLEHLNKR